jgi:hypothetical protein
MEPLTDAEELFMQFYKHYPGQWRPAIRTEFEPKIPPEVKRVLDETYDAIMEKKWP